VVHFLIVTAGRYLIVVSILVAAAFLIHATAKLKIALVWRLLVGGALAEVLALLSGSLFYDTRPFVASHLTPLIAHAPDNGFPSDHVLLASFLGFAVLLYSRRLGLLLLVVALVIGWARVAAHIHRPIDVIGSFVLSAVSVTSVQLAARFYDHRRHPALDERPTV
jgi:undecaprenyl-diphosphatase